ncbi:hypothetical protein [Gelidibacter sediminis]|uniref:hypothetical protein n=1 Tax=Gelidibacter sediminis TaxID=1608710 RepID=UPI00105B89FF|nr:hypothetical protein [Gelidibacter sediminis]
MKGKLFMYAFIFALLLMVFQYVNSKNIFESYQDKMNKHIEKERVLKDSIKKLNIQLDKFRMQSQ